MTNNKWLCLQLGSREHYAIPRALHSEGLLQRLLTDSWVPSRWKALVGMAHRSLALRNHDEIPDELVTSSTIARIAKDLLIKSEGLRGWESILKRNQWFEQWSLEKIKKESSGAGVLFSYSYTARLPFQEAKRLGMKCVLGQIDPGPLENALVVEADASYPYLGTGSPPPPNQYWEGWREEIELSDLIIANSPWSLDLLVKAGVPKEKLTIIPLAYEGQGAAEQLSQIEKSAHHLKVLFLGQVIVRKGIGQLFDAIRLCIGKPIKFVIAGPIGLKIPEDIAANQMVEILGAVDRETAMKLYQTSDAFLLPTLSDGFAITQLEALAYRVPVIASKACGAVVTDGVNGILLDHVSGESISLAIDRLLSDPNLLKKLKENAEVPSIFSMKTLQETLGNIKFKEI